MNDEAETQLRERDGHDPRGRRPRGGAANAATKPAKNSVGTKQLKNGAVTTAKLKKGAVDASRLSASALSGYAKSSDLSSYAKSSDLSADAKAPVGPDQIGTLPAASLSGSIYNVGGGVDCQGTNGNFPSDKVDDIDFFTVDFDTAGLVHTEPGAVAHCYNGFAISRAGTYLISAWIGWEGTGGIREISIRTLNSSHVILQTLGTEGQDATITGETEESVSGIARLQPGDTVVIVGNQTYGSPMGLAGGDLQIAWAGS